HPRRSCGILGTLPGRPRAARIDRLGGKGRCSPRSTGRNGRFGKGPVRQKARSATGRSGMRELGRWAGIAVVTIVLGAAATEGSACAEEIVVSNYGVAANGMPFAVAMAKGFFKEEGADVTGIISSAGGGTTLRNMLAGNAPHAEVTPNAVIAAVQQGA